MNLLTYIYLFFLFGQADAASNAGRTFYQTFNFNHPTVEPTVLHAFILSTEADQCEIEVTVNGPPLVSTTVPVSNAQAVVHPVNVDATRGIKLNATCDFVVYGLNFATESADGWMAIPVESLDMEYIILGVEPWLPEPIQLSIVAAFDDTTCTCTFPNGTQYISQLDEIGVEYITSDQDMTGTLISCNKKVTVMTGQRCSNFPRGCIACDHTVEQVPPKFSLGRNFAMVPLFHSCRKRPTCCSDPIYCAKCIEIYRILAVENDTLIRRNGTETSETFTLDAGQSRYILLSQNEFSHLISSKPVLLGHYFNGQGYEGHNEDPAFAIIPQVESYSDRYQAATCFPQFQSHFLNLVVPKGTSSHLLLNGQTFLNANSAHDIPGTNYEAFQYQFNCSDGPSNPVSFKIEHTQNGTFGMFAYGFSEYISYGYPGGMKLDRDIFYKCTPSRLNLTGNNRIWLESCNVTETNPDFGDVSYWTDQSCCPGNVSLTHVDTVTNSSCNKTVQRVWTLRDGCDRSISVNQTAIIYPIFDLYHSPPKDIHSGEQCSSVYESNATGEPERNRSCGTTENITFVDETDNKTYVNRTWTIHQYCTDEMIMFTQTIHCGSNDSSVSTYPVSSTLTPQTSHAPPSSTIQDTTVGTSQPTATTSTHKATYAVPTSHSTASAQITYTTTTDGYIDTEGPISSPTTEGPSPSTVSTGAPPTSTISPSHASESTEGSTASPTSTEGPNLSILSTRYTPTSAASANPTAGLTEVPPTSTATSASTTLRPSPSTVSTEVPPTSTGSPSPVSAITTQSTEPATNTTIPAANKIPCNCPCRCKCRHRHRRRKHIHCDHEQYDYSSSSSDSTEC